MSEMPGKDDKPAMPEGVRKFLKGKKTYITAAVIIIVGVLRAYNVEIPPYVWAALSALGLGFLRAAVSKAERPGA